ncbi:hypothetical protein M434DRAFT_190487 [Hypoxylon sp. CO27-5]|nr:hypothetical protein M434DRAFT_190487 [Hypoxylon sp. CO27-5]
MLVRLHDQFLRSSPHRQLQENSMALIPVKFDYKSQIIDNCEFFVAKYDLVSVITTKDAIGDYKAYAIRSNDDTRDVLLSSDPCNAAWKAVESLHTKSCEAAHQYITTNGFSYPPDLKKSRLDEDDEKDEENDDDDEDAASVVSGRSASSTVALSYWGSSDDEAAMTPASPADPHAGCRGTSRNEKSNNNISKRRSKPPAGARQARDFNSRFPVDGPDDSDDDEGRQHQQLPVRVRLVSPMRSSPVAGMSYRPPPPPPNWTGPQMPPPPMRGIPVSAPPQSQPGPHHYPQPPPGQPMPTPLPPPMSIPPSAHTIPATATTGPVAPGIPTRASTIPSLHYKASAPNLNANLQPSPPHPNPNHPAPRLYDVRLTIRWLGHGEQRILESSRASIRALQEMAVGYVRTHASAFDKGNGVAAATTTTTTTDIRWGLRACVRRAFFGPGEAYDMSTYRGDDLTKLFNVLSAGNIPRFEVEVDTVVPQQQHQLQHQNQQMMD